LLLKLLHDHHVSLAQAARLSATDTERQVCGENYKRAFDPDNVFDLHDDLTDHVVTALATVLARMFDQIPEGIVATGKASAPTDQPFSFSEPQPLDHHDELRWLAPDEFGDVAWLESDVVAVRALAHSLGS
jgi:hypothetical protein